MHAMFNKQIRISIVIFSCVNITRLAGYLAEQNILIDLIHILKNSVHAEFSVFNLLDFVNDSVSLINLQNMYTYLLLFGLHLMVVLAYMLTCLLW